MTNLLEKWEKECAFEEVLEDRGPDHRPKKEFGYIRADYDVVRWCNIWWPINMEFEDAEEIADELNRLYAAFKETFPELSDLRRFCQEGNAGCVEGSNDEYNMFLTGEYADYWFRLITRSGDYNLYLHAYGRKPKEPKE